LIGIDLVDALSPDSEFADLDQLGGKAGYLMFVGAADDSSRWPWPPRCCWTRRHFDVAAARQTYRRSGCWSVSTLLLTR